jgi:hypothetical protein
MALANFTLTAGYWRKISTAGQSGAAWLKSADGFSPNIKIVHTASVQTYNPDDDPDLGALDDNIPYASAVGMDIDVAYNLPQNGISAELTADSVSDVFYATVVNTGKTAIITVDFA